MKTINYIREEILQLANCDRTTRDRINDLFLDLARNYKRTETSTCNCDCATLCPLGKTGMSARCTADELRDGTVAQGTRVAELQAEIERLNTIVDQNLKKDRLQIEHIESLKAKLTAAPAQPQEAEMETVRCTACDGFGSVHDVAEIKTCRNCDGSGRMPKPAPAPVADDVPVWLKELEEFVVYWKSMSSKKGTGDVPRKPTWKQEVRAWADGQISAANLDPTNNKVIVDVMQGLIGFVDALYDADMSEKGAGT